MNTDLLPNLREWRDRLKADQHPLTLTLNAAIVALEGKQPPPAQQLPEGLHRECKNGCQYALETGAHPHNVCPEGECQHQARCAPAETLEAKIHAVRLAAGSNQFTIDLCGDLAEICDAARRAATAETHMLADDNDSIVAACNCLTKSPEIKFHKRGCKYRLIEERNAAEAERDRLRVALEQLRSDCQSTIDQYNRNGPQWTSRESGAEYYDASYVIASAEERIATINEALARPADGSLAQNLPLPATHPEAQVSIPRDELEAILGALHSDENTLGVLTKAALAGFERTYLP